MIWDGKNGAWSLAIYRVKSHAPTVYICGNVEMNTM
jgi:hypothetical protein